MGDGGVGSLRDKDEGVHVAFPLHGNDATRLAIEFVSNQLVGCRGHLDRSWNSFRFHAACGVDDVALQVVGELVSSDDPGHYRP